MKTTPFAILAILFLLMGCAELFQPTWNTTTGETIKEPSSPIVEDTVLTEDTPETTTTPVENTPRKAITEGELVSFPNLQATDPDGDPITYTFTPPLDKSGKWQTKVGDAGEYTVTITASDGKNSVSQEVIIEVTPKNRPPKIELSSHEITVKEGDTITLNPTVTDSDGDQITVTYDGWMNAATRTTTFDDAGAHETEIIANDGTTTTRERVRIVVENINRAPVINPLQDVIIKEGDKITINAVATDPDQDKITFTYTTPINPDGTWQSSKDDVGKYRINVTASDGKLTASTNFLVVVESLNKPPLIQIVDLLTVDEGQTVTLTPIITDPEGDEMTITYTGWMTSTTYATTYDDSGSHLVTITASDGINTAKKDVTVMVNDVNRPPTFGNGAFN